MVVFRNVDKSYCLGEQVFTIIQLLLITHTHMGKTFKDTLKNYNVSSRDKKSKRRSKKTPSKQVESNTFNNNA